LDWAILRLDREVPGLEPAPLARLGATAKAVRWSTAGYASVRMNYGGAFHGEILVHGDDAMDLHCAELVAATYDDAKGLSGAPCIVDGAVVGVVVSVFRRPDGEIAAGHVRAVPMERVFAETSLLSDADGVPLPWEDVFAASIEGLASSMRESVARDAGFATPL